MTGVRVTGEAVNVAVKKAGWNWGELDPFGEATPTPAECMRPILEAAAAHLVDDRITAALKLHGPRCGRCYGLQDGCTCADATWLDPEDRHPRWECLVCVASWGEEATEPWPCPTARALGVES